MGIQHKICLLVILVGSCVFAGVQRSAPIYCKSPGMMCDTTFRKVGLCPGDINSWEQLGECESGSCVCGGGLCKCSEENMLHQSRSPVVTCQRVGMYPDPLDCGKSVFCNAPGEPAVACRICSGTETYDACTGECKPNGKCSAPILCKNIGVQEGVVGNEWIYYACLPNRLIMNYCDLNPFNPKDHKCNSEDKSLCVHPSVDINLCNQTSTTTTATTSSAPTSITPPETTSPTVTSITPPETTSPTVTSITPSETTSSTVTSVTVPETTSPTVTSITPPETTSPTVTSVTVPETTSPTVTSVTVPETTSPTVTSITPPKTTSPTVTSITPPETTSPTVTSITPPETTSPTITSITSPETTSPPSTSITPPKTTSNSPIICTHFGPMKDPVNCHGFYFCDSSLIPHPINCWPGYWYDDNAEQCVEGDCMSLYS